MRSGKEKQILEFVEKHGGAPLQRTPAWISLRRSVVGASELAALVGMSPYVFCDAGVLVGHDFRRRGGLIC